jgi:hypothetical protein
MKFLAEERRQCVLDFTQAKLQLTENAEFDFKIFTLVANKQVNIQSEIITAIANKAVEKASNCKSILLILFSAFTQ